MREIIKSIGYTVFGILSCVVVYAGAFYGWDWFAAHYQYAREALGFFIGFVLFICLVILVHRIRMDQSRYRNYLKE